MTRLTDTSPSAFDPVNGAAASKRLFERAARLTPGGVHSNSRWRAPHPRYFHRAQGPYAWDVDGQKHLDLVMGNGAVILGHNDPQVQESVRQALDTGLTAGLEWERAAEVAELILKAVPWMDQVRFTNTGTEAALHALHIARFVTGRTRIAKVEGSYHGWADELFVSVWPDLDQAGPAEAPRSLPGAPGLLPAAVQNVLVLPFNNSRAAEALLDEHGNDLAAVILEPVLIDVGHVPATKEYLETLRRQCTRYGIVLIFDELLTGFRLAPGGAQEHYGVQPDLAIFGKAIANGYPLAAIAGREQFMSRSAPGQGTAYVGTFNGHVVPLAAALATLPRLLSGDIQQTLAMRTRKLADAFATAAKRMGVTARLVGNGGHFHWYFTDTEIRDYRSSTKTDARKCAAFVAELYRRGVLCAPGSLSHQAISLAHDDHVLEELCAAFEAGLVAASKS